MVNDYADILSQVKKALTDTAATHGIPAKDIHISSDFGINTPAPFVFVGGEFDRLVDEGGALAEMKVIIRVGAKAARNNEGAMQSLMGYVQKLIPILIDEGLAFEGLEELFTRSDRCIFDIEFKTNFKLF